MYSMNFAMNFEERRSTLRTRNVVVALCAASVLTAVPLTIHAAGLKKELVGRQSDGSVVTSTNQTLRPAGRQIEFRGRPNAVAIHPNGQTAAFLNGTYKAIVIVDLASNAVKQEFVAAGSSASFDGLVYSKDGSKLYASQDNRIVIANVALDGSIALDRYITDLPRSRNAYPGREDGNPYPGGLALSDDGNTLYVALNRNNSLGVVDLVHHAFVKEISVGNAPHAVAVQGGIAYVSNQGGRPARTGEFTNDSSGTRIVADRTSGRAITGSVSIVDLGAGREVKTIEVGEQPTAMLLDGRRLFVANTNSDTVSVIDRQAARVVKTIAVKPFHGAPLGSSPNGLALMSEDRLVVSLGRNNALAVYGLGRRMYDSVEFEGLIPTGWYPTSVAADRLNSRLVLANGKGVGSLGPTATVGPDPSTNRTGKWVHSNMGSASIIAFPRGDELESYTRSVYRNNHWTRIAGDDGSDADRAHRSERDSRERDSRADSKPMPLPEKAGGPSVFKHVFYIVKENRTYDQILGDLPQGNGDLNLVQFGRQVTPNHHALAENFVLLDNLYDSGSNSADGHQWVTQAFVPDYVEKSFGGFTRSYPFNAGDALVYSGSGFLWENAIRHGKSVRVYGEYISGLRADGVEMGPWLKGLGHGKTEAGKWRDFYRDAKNMAGGVRGAPAVKLEAHSDIPSLQAVLNPAYPPYHQIIPDQYRVEVFLKEFKEYVKNGNLPNLVVMALTNDHTVGSSPDYPTPRAMVADNDLALGRVVEAISHSPYWKDSVIFVIEDDAQNGVDHVDGHRTLGLVISPYTQRAAVDSHYYTQIDFVRTMEQILGLPPMNQMDMAVEPTSMKHVFVAKPDFAPFKALPNQIPLDEMNPGSVALEGLQKKWAIASSKLDFSAPDVADKELLNRVIWYTTKGYDRAYPGDERVLAPSEVHAYLESRQKPGLRAERD